MLQRDRQPPLETARLCLLPAVWTQVLQEGSCTVHWRMTPLNTKPRGIWGGFQTSAVWSATESALRIHAKSSSVCHSFAKTTVPSHSLKKLHSSLPERGTPHRIPSWGGALNAPAQGRWPNSPLVQTGEEAQCSCAVNVATQKLCPETRKAAEPSSMLRMPRQAGEDQRPAGSLSQASQYPKALVA